MGKLCIAAFVAAIVLFAWNFVAHVMLPIGAMGVSALPQDALAVESMRTTIPESGLYIYPYVDPADSTAEKEEAMNAQAKAGPVIFMAYDHDGREIMPLSSLLISFATNLVSAFLAALILTQIAGGFGARFMTVVILGLFAGVTMAVPQWTWYGFNGDFTVAALLITGGGWFLAGLPLAMIVKPDKS